MAEWIRTADAVARLAEDLRECRALALDSESDSLYHHFDKVCLIQISIPGEDLVIDPLRKLGMDVAPISLDTQMNPLHWRTMP